MNRTVLITRCSSGSDLLGERRGSVGNRDCAAFEELAAAVPSLPRDARVDRCFASRGRRGSSR
jgi:hypothetical protein